MGKITQASCIAVCNDCWDWRLGFHVAYLISVDRGFTGADEKYNRYHPEARNFFLFEDILKQAVALHWCINS